MKIGTEDRNQEIKRFEYILNKQVQYEVTRYINNAIKPTIDKIVAEVSEEAVRNWTSHIQLELEAMSYSTNIQINFVEHVVKTVMKENDIKIEVRK